MSEATQQNPGGGQATSNGTGVDQLDFLDLLYAVPVGDLAMRVSGAPLSKVSAAGWSALAMILATIVLSWIGLHKNRSALADDGHGRDSIGRFSFWSRRFLQFLIEIIIIGMYFTLGQFLHLPAQGDHLTAPPPAENWLTGLLTAIFALYLAWDCLDYQLAKVPYWRTLAWDGGWVTGLALVPVGGTFLGILITSPRTATPVIVVNICLIALLYAYRIAQDSCGNTRDTNAASGNQVERQFPHKLLAWYSRGG